MKMTRIREVCQTSITCRIRQTFIKTILFCAVGLSLCGFSPESARAAVQSTRIGILYSANSEDYFGDAFVFRQLFTAVQAHAVQAGVPFDLLQESDLGDLEKLSGYRAIVIPALQTVEDSMVPTYRENLRKLLWEQGTALIAADAFFSYNQSGNYQASQTTEAMRDIFGLGFGTFGTFSNVTMTANGSTHPVASLIKSPASLAEYDSVFYQEYQQWVGFPTDKIAWFKHGTNTRVAIQAATRGNGRMVHFSDMMKMVDSQILWAAIQWCLSGSNNPSMNVHLSMTRQDGIFLPRNDMDLSRFLSVVGNVHFPLLDILKRWKDDYDFAGSFYINIGNDMQNGVYTDWDLSGPLYREYIGIGNEIGTHSYTHPQDTKQLNASELQFEFLDSREEIASRLGYPVNGTGIPGEDENLFVYDTIKPWFDYISGHTLYSGSRRVQNLGIGYLTPAEDTVYFSLNMTPDFVLGDILQLSPAEASAVWQQELESQSLNMRQPVLHWLWHDYGIINPGGSPYYGPQAFEDIVARAHAEGMEFMTLDEYVKRFKAFREAEVMVDYLSAGQVQVDIQGTGLGGLTVEFPENSIIVSAGSHYAYNNKRLFLDEDGGSYSVQLGSGTQDVTRIVDISPGLRLNSITGDGSLLDFQVSGQGTVALSFNTVGTGKYQITGASSISYIDGGAILTFEPDSTYNVAVRSTDNLMPSAEDAFATTSQAQSVTINLTATDFDGFLSNMVIIDGPSSGIATIDNLTVTYTPEAGFTGTDTMIYQVTDNQGLTAQATVTVQVLPVNISDGDGSYNFVSRPVIVDGDNSDWEGLEMIISDPVEFASATNPLDYTDIYLAHNETRFFMFYRSAFEAPLNWAHNAFIDSDNLKQTGFILGGTGADFLVQGSFIYRYTGTGLDWSWQQVSNIVIGRQGQNVEVSLDRTLFGGSTSIRLLFLADNSAYTGGSELDLVPDDVFSSTTGYLSYSFFSETTNAAPVARSASYSINEGEQLSLVLQGIDLDGDSLSYGIATAPANGQLSGTAPNLVYTPNPGFSGNDQFTFTVFDGAVTSAPATVSISVTSMPVEPDKISNGLVSGLILDGNLDDWAGLVPFAADPVDQSGSGNLLDWTRIRMAHTSQDVYLAYSNTSGIQFNWAYSLYVDTDLDSSTGFRASYIFTGIGAEYLIQSDYIYRYTGDGTNWSWTFVGSAQSAIQNTNVELAFPRSLIGSPAEINVVAIGENVAYPNGSTTDLYPDNSVSDGGVLNYAFGTVPSPASLAAQSARTNATPVPPLIPHTVRIWFVAPDAINPDAPNAGRSSSSWMEMRMTARPNTTWRIIHSNDLITWQTIRTWPMLGSFSEFSFPMEESDVPQGASFGFFEALELPKPAPVDK